MQNAGEVGESNLPLIAVQYSAYGARQGEKVILDFVTATADIFLTPPSLRTPPLYFAVQNTEEEGEMYSPFASSSILYTTPRKAAGHGRGGVLKYPFDSGT